MTATIIAFLAGAIAGIIHQSITAARRRRDYRHRHHSRHHPGETGCRKV